MDDVEITEKLCELLKSATNKEDVVMEMVRQLTEDEVSDDEIVIGERETHSADEVLLGHLSAALKDSMHELKSSVYNNRALKEYLKQAAQRFMAFLSASGKKEQGGVKEDAGKEDAGKEDAGKEDAGKEDAGKEDAGKEDVSKEEVVGDRNRRSSGPVACQAMLRVTSYTNDIDKLTTDQEIKKSNDIKPLDAPMQQQQQQQQQQQHQQQLQQQQHQHQQQHQQHQQQQHQQHQQQQPVRSTSGEGACSHQDLNDTQSSIHVDEHDHAIILSITRSPSLSPIEAPIIDPNTVDEGTESSQEESKIQKDKLEKTHKTPPQAFHATPNTYKSHPQPPPSTSTDATSLPPSFLMEFMKDLDFEQPELANLVRTTKPQRIPAMLCHLNRLNHHVSLCEEVVKREIAGLK